MPVLLLFRFTLEIFQCIVTGLQHVHNTLGSVLVHSEFNSFPIIISVMISFQSFLTKKQEQLSL